MDESKVKGFMFERALNYIKKKLGTNALDDLGMAPVQFLQERWYPLSDFCSVLAHIDYQLSDYHTENVYKLGLDMIIVDPRWAHLFRGKDPKEVFTSTLRQDDSFKVGDFETVSIDEGRIKLKMHLLTDDPDHIRLWQEYYRGCLDGILLHIGKNGHSEVLKDPDGDIQTCIYDIFWS